MARKNRLVVMDGLYHVTARVAHQERLLRDPAFKKLIVDWIYGIADFSGVEVCAWNVMDNHLHIFVRVPPVPEKYWLDKPERNPDGSVLREGTVPNSPAFSMRPNENRAPRWTPDLDDPACVITPAGDSPSREAILTAIAEGLHPAIQAEVFLPRIQLCSLFPGAVKHPAQTAVTAGDDGLHEAQVGKMPVVAHGLRLNGVPEKLHAALVFLLRDLCLPLKCRVGLRHEPTGGHRHAQPSARRQAGSRFFPGLFS